MIDSSLKGLPDDLKEVYTSLESVATATSKLTPQAARIAREFAVASGNAEKLAKQYQAVSIAAHNVFDGFSRGQRITVAQIAEYSKLNKCVGELKKQYEDLARVEKVLEVASRSTSQHIKASFENLTKLSTGAVQYATKLGGLALGHQHLTESLLKYNRAAFEGMRIGERYGDSLEKFNRGLKTVSSQTALSRQDFAELNTSLKQLTVGLPMTSEEVGKLAAVFSGKLGWSVDAVKKAITDLIPLQNKLPDLFQRITKLSSDFTNKVEGAAASAKDLRDQLRALGASQQDIETAMSAVASATSPDIQGWMDFEKVISQSKRDIQDANLAISEKMQSGLEGIAKTQAKIAEGIAWLPKWLLLGVGAFSLFGAEALKVSATVAGIVMQLAVAKKLLVGTSGGVGGMAAQASMAITGSSAGRIGQKGGIDIQPPGTMPHGSALSGATGRLGKFFKGAKPIGSIGAGIGISLAGEAVSAGANWLGNKWIENDQVRNAGDRSHAMKLAGTGAIGSAAKWGGYGNLVGGVPGAVIGAGVGAIVGGVGGWMKGRSIEKEAIQKQKETKEQRALLASGSAAKAGIMVKDSSSEEKVLASIKEERDVQKQIVALQDMYARGQINIKQVEDNLKTNITDQKELRQKIQTIKVQTFSTSKDILNTEMGIEKAAQGRLDALRAQLDIVEKIKTAGSGAVQSFLEGNMGADTMESLGKSGVAASKMIADNLRQQLTMAYISAFSNTKDVKALVSKSDLKDIETIRVKSNEIASKKAEASEKFRKTPGSDEDKRKYSDEMQQLQVEEENLLNRQRGLFEKLDLSKVFPLSDVKAKLKEVNEEFVKIQQAKDAGATTWTVDNKTVEINEAQIRLQNKLVELNTLQKQQADAAGKAKDDELSTATAKTQRLIDLNQQQIELGRANLAIAEKLGMPQSFAALQNQVRLVNDQYEAVKRLQKEQDVVFNNWGKQGVAVQKVLDGTISVEDALKGSSVAPKEREKAEIEITKILRARTEAQIKEKQLVGELADLTKTMREGWMDAMEESIINAGDFTALIGVGATNVAEKLDVGGVNTGRYGGQAVLTPDQMAELRKEKATRYTRRYGELEGKTNITEQNSLFRYTDAYSGYGSVEETIKNAKAGRIPPPPATSAAAQAYIGEAEEKRMQQPGAGTIPIPGAKPPTSEDIKNALRENPAEIKNPNYQPIAGVTTPPLIEAKVVDKFDGTVRQLGEAAANLNEASKRWFPDKKGAGGLLRFAAGGGVSRQNLPYAWNSSHAASFEAFQGEAERRYARNKRIRAQTEFTTADVVLHSQNPSRRKLEQLPQEIEKALAAADEARAHYREMKDGGTNPEAMAQATAAYDAANKNKNKVMTKHYAAAAQREEASRNTHNAYTAEQKAKWEERNQPMTVAERNGRLSQGMGNNGNGGAKQLAKSAEHLNGAKPPTSEDIKNALRENPAEIKNPNYQPASFEAFQDEAARRYARNKRIRSQTEFTNSDVILHSQNPSRRKLEQLPPEIEKALAAADEARAHYREMKDGGTNPEAMAQATAAYDAANKNKNEVMTKHYAAAAQREEASRNTHNAYTAEQKAKWEERNQPMTVAERNRRLSQGMGNNGNDGAKQLAKSAEHLNGASRKLEKSSTHLNEVSTGRNTPLAAAQSAAGQNTRFTSVAERNASFTPMGFYASDSRVQRMHANGGSSDSRWVNRKQMAGGGMIEPGSYVVKTSAASKHSDLLNSVGAGWVTGGTPGQDSVLFGIGRNNGGAVNPSGALLMPGEAVVPPQFAHIGAAINNGVPKFDQGGSISGSGQTASVQSGDGNGIIRIELSPDAAQLLRIRNKKDYSNGAMP